jgi:hypothetical protein
MARTIIRSALILAALTISLPLLFIMMIIIIAQLSGFPTSLVYASFVLLVIGLPAAFVYVRHRVAPDIFSNLKPNTKKDWERLGIALTLIFTVIATLAALQAIYGQTVTQSRCYDSNNAQVNMTSTNCRVVQTVSLPQQGLLGAWGILVLDIVLLTLGAFGLWIAVLYGMQKAGIE